MTNKTEIENIRPSELIRAIEERKSFITTIHELKKAYSLTCIEMRSNDLVKNNYLASYYCYIISSDHIQTINDLGLDIESIEFDEVESKILITISKHSELTTPEQYNPHLLDVTTRIFNSHIPSLI